MHFILKALMRTNKPYSLFIMLIKDKNCKTPTQTVSIFNVTWVDEKEKAKGNYLKLIDSIQAKSAETPNGDRLIGFL